MKRTEKDTDAALWAAIAKRMEMVYENSQFEEVIEKLDVVINRLDQLEANGGEKWYTMEQVLENLDLSPSTFREWRMNGLKVSTVGRKIYVSQAVIDEFLVKNQKY